LLVFDILDLLELLTHLGVARSVSESSRSKSRKEEQKWGGIGVGGDILYDMRGMEGEGDGGRC
jgi:hypothetical protein